MAQLTNHIIVENKLRPCIVIHRRGLFHKWEDRVDPAMPNRGEKRYTVGIIELDDGSVIQAYPKEIRFVDDWVNTIHDNLI